MGMKQPLLRDGHVIHLGECRSPRKSLARDGPRIQHSENNGVGGSAKSQKPNRNVRVRVRVTELVEPVLVL